MQMPEATKEQLEQAAASPLHALTMAHEMLDAIRHQHSFDSFDYLLRADAISAAATKLKREASPDAPGDEPAPDATAIDITPESLKTPEGRQKVNATMEAFTDATVEVANLAGQFVDEWGQAIEETGEPERAEDIRDLRAACRKRKRTQDDMLRAIANRY